MTLRWPWQRPARHRQDRLVFSRTPEGLAWVHAQPAGERLRVSAHGQLAREEQSDAAWARALRQLGLPAAPATAVLPLPAYQLLQIDAPVVPPDELRAAARWRAKDMVDGHIDDVTLDVMRLGLPGSHVQGNEQMFVVAAPNREVAAAAALAESAGWRLAVVDVADTAQRNLQHAAAQAMELGDRATACLALHDARTCLLTICAGGELYYSRRLEWDATLLARAERQAQPPAPASPPPNADGTAQHYMLSSPEGGPRSFSFDELPTDALGGYDFATAADNPGNSSADHGDSAALPAAAEFAADDTPRLVVELQRSFDVWERSWPDLPLALLMLQVPSEEPQAVAEFLQAQLGLRVLPLDLAAGLELGTSPAALPLPTLLPLLGALLRDRSPEA